MPTITIDIKKETLIDLLVCAVEGGSNYWATFSNPKPLSYEYDSITVTEDEAPALGTFRRVDRVTADDLIKGIQLLAKDPPLFGSAPYQLKSIISGDADADTADVVLQLTIFGELVYG